MYFLNISHGALTREKSVNLQYDRKLFLKINSASSLLKLIMQNGSSFFSSFVEIFFSNLVPFKHDITSPYTAETYSHLWMLK